MSERGIRAQVVAETADVDLMRVLALQGRGIAAMRENVVRDDLAAGRLVKIPGAPSDIMHEVWVVVPVRPPADEEAREGIKVVLAMKPLSGRAAKQPA